MRLCPIALFATIAGAGLMLPPGASAAPIPVSNFSFEDPNLTDGQANGVMPGWTFTGAAGEFDPQSAQFAGTDGDNVNTGGTLPDGGQVAIITTYFGGVLGGAFSQIVGTVAADTVYTLTVGIGRRADLQTGAWSIELLAGATTIAIDSDVSGPGGGTVVDHSAIAGPFAVGNAFVGQSLSIRISASNVSENTATAQNVFDDVRLTAEIPEPASAMGVAAAAMMGGLARRRRRSGM